MIKAINQKHIPVRAAFVTGEPAVNKKNIRFNRKTTKNPNSMKEQEREKEIIRILKVP